MNSESLAKTLTELPGYDARKVQMLGHDEHGVLAWYNCGETKTDE